VGEWVGRRVGGWVSGWVGFHFCLICMFLVIVGEKGGWATGWVGGRVKCMGGWLGGRVGWVENKVLHQLQGWLVPLGIGPWPANVST
jgi:hypothetical protein